MLRDLLRRRLFPAEPFHQDAFHEAIRARLPSHGKVLDLGCGDHAPLRPYRTAEREIWGTDFHRHPRLAEPEWFRLLPPDGAIPFADATFDLVVSDWVIEHVSRPRVFLSEVKRVLKPGGRYVAHSISGAHYLTWVRRLFDLAPHELVQEVIYRLYRREHHDTFPTHYRLNTTGQIQAAARAAGLDLEQLDFFATQHYFHFSSVLETLAIFADRFLECFGAGLGRIYFVLVLRK